MSNPHDKGVCDRNKSDNKGVCDQCGVCRFCDTPPVCLSKMNHYVYQIKS